MMDTALAYRPVFLKTVDMSCSTYVTANIISPFFTTYDKIYSTYAKGNNGAYLHSAVRSPELLSTACFKFVSLQVEGKSP
eukprot:7450808-Ditylum_brightwellii.AAC.1